MDPKNLDQIWASIQASRQDNNFQLAESQGRSYVSQPEALAGHVAELLAWALDLPLEDNGKSLAQRVAPSLMDDPAVSTLCLLILEPARPREVMEPSAMAARIRPEALSTWKPIMARAYLLKAQCFEVMGDWSRMAEQAEEAAGLGVEADQANYWRARALLHLGDAQAAAAALGPRPLIGLKRWTRLSHIIALWAKADLALVDNCVQILEGKWGEPEPAEKNLVLQGIEQALRPNVGDTSGQLETILRYSERVSRLVGPLPTLQFNLAIQELVKDRNYERQLTRLTRAEGKDPAWGYQSHLLKLICTLVLGHRQEFSACLEKLPPLPEAFAADLRFFQAMNVVLGTLEKNTPLKEKPGLLEDIGAVQAGQLGGQMPVLPAVGLLCQRLFTDQEPPTSLFQALEGCDWAQWMWLRIWVRKSSRPGEVYSFLQDSDLHAPALLWDEFAWIQEFQAFLPPEGQVRLQEKLLDYKADLASLPPFWQEQVAQRVTLANESIGTLAHISNPPEEAAEANPWWVEGHFLQELVKVDGEIEANYLRGRLALRQADPARALKCFKQARALGSKSNLAGRLSLAAGFVPYWEGVALAHLGRYEQAAEALGECQAGPKALEASAQLGMIALAQGKLPESQAWLDACSAVPELPAAQYLRALLAEPHDPAGALELVAPLEADGSPGNAVYVGAAHRLHAAIQERRGDLEGATLYYRQVLEAQPADAAAAIRLTRLWVHQKYEAIRRGEKRVIEPPSDGLQQAIEAVQWGPALKDLLKELQQIDRVADTGRTLQLPTKPAYQRLLLRSLLASGNARDVLRRVQAAPGSAEERYLNAIRQLAQLGDSLSAYLLSDPAAGSQILEGMTTGLRSLSADLAAAIPALRFWRECLKQLQKPQASLAEAFFAMAADENVPLPQRTWVAAWGLFSPDSDQRQEAAQVISGLAAQNALLDPHLRSALLALAAQLQGRDQDFLACYSEVEKDFSNLPYSENEIYLLACEVRLRARQPDPVLRSPKPATLSPHNSELDHLRSLAFIQCTAQNALTNPRQALLDLERAEILLDAGR